MGRAASRDPQHKPPGDGGLPAELSRELDRQHQAVQDTMERMMNQRLEQLERTGDLGGGSPRRSRAGSWIVNVVMIAGLAMVLVQLHLVRAQLRSIAGGTDASQPQHADAAAEDGHREEPAPEVESGRTAEEQAAAELGHDGDWLATWKALVANRPDQVAACFRGIESARGLAEDQVSDMQQQRFGSLATALTNGEPIDAQLHLARIGVFEYAVLQGSDSGDARLNLLVDSINHKRLAELVAELDISSFEGEEDLKSADPQLQAAIAVMWVLRNRTLPEP